MRAHGSRDITAGFLFCLALGLRNCFLGGMLDGSHSSSRGVAEVCAGGVDSLGRWGVERES